MNHNDENNLASKLEHAQREYESLQKVYGIVANEKVNVDQQKNKLHAAILNAISQFNQDNYQKGIEFLYKALEETERMK